MCVYVCVCVCVCVTACAAIGERCANGRCSLPRERCDGVNNCGDYSDETGCSMLMSDYYDKSMIQSKVCAKTAET